MTTILYLGLVLAGVFALAMKRAPLWLWAIAAAIAAYAGLQSPLTGDPAALSVLPVLAGIIALVCASLSIAPLRKMILTRPAFNMIRSVLPKVSETEQQALDAGTIGFDAELFSGRPDWEKLRSVPGIVLTDEERAFLDGPTEELCAMLNDWQIRHHENEIPENVWDFAKSHGFLGMLISKRLLFSRLDFF